MAGKSIKAKAYKNNNFEKTREGTSCQMSKINSIFVLSKAANRVEEDCPE